MTLNSRSIVLLLPLKQWDCQREPLCPAYTAEHGGVLVRARPALGQPSSVGVVQQLHVRAPERWGDQGACVLSEEQRL